MRTRHKPWADDYLKDNQQVVELEPTIQRNGWGNNFPVSQPIHLEIGTGKGQFICGMAKQYPNVNFIGIEVVKSIIVSAVQKVNEEQVSNVRLINEDAKDLREMFSENEISHIYLNFSDPWPKNRHEKRRLTYSTFLEQYKAILKENGKLTLKTDNQSLFEYSLVSFSNFGMVLEEVTLDLHAIEDTSNIMTEYEEKFSAKGQPIYRCVARFV